MIPFRYAGLLKNKRLNYLQRSSLHLNERHVLEGKGTPGHTEERQDVYTKKRDFQKSRMKEINSFLDGECLGTLTEVYLSPFCHFQLIMLSVNFSWQLFSFERDYFMSSLLDMFPLAYRRHRLCYRSCNHMWLCLC